LNIIFFSKVNKSTHLPHQKTVAVYYSLIIYVNNSTFQIFTYIGAKLNNTRWSEL